jgi:hypothetical protein
MEIQKFREAIERSASYWTAERLAEVEAEDRAMRAEERKARVLRLVDWGFPEDKVALVSRYSTTDARMGQLWQTPEVQEYTRCALDKPRPWFFVSANAGSGKTSLLTKLAADIFASDGLRVRFFRFGSMLDECAKPEDILRGGWDAYCIDQFWRHKWMAQAGTQDQALDILDILYSTGKAVLIASDKPIETLKAAMLWDDSKQDGVRPQIIGRIRERTRGRFVLRFKGVDLRS